MSRKNSALAIVRLAAVLVTGHCAAMYAGGGSSGNSLGYEFIGQVLNASATQSLQYGYLSSVPGLNSVSATNGPVSEANALLSFYNDTATQQVINNGPIRVIDRTGTATIYFNAAGGGKLHKSGHLPRRHTGPNLQSATSGGHRYFKWLFHRDIRNDHHVRPSV